MRHLAAITMPFVKGFAPLRTIGRRLCARLRATLPAGLRAGLPATLAARPLAGLAAMATLLAIGVYILFSPGADESRAVQAASAAPGGETVVSKFARSKRPYTKFAQSRFAPAAQPAPMAADVTAEPTPASRLLAMALATVPSAVPPRSTEPTLEGLSEIPRELIWNRPPKSKKDEAEPKAFGAFSKVSEVLPWDAIEPVPFSPLKPKPVPVRATAKAVAALGPPIDLPKGGQVETWMRAKATEFKGVDRARPLYHFELWLEPPASVKRRLVGVSYAFSTPAIRPQSQASSDQASGFRISAGGLACADEITVTLTFDDGRAQKVAVDGCKLLS